MLLSPGPHFSLSATTYSSFAPCPPLLASPPPSLSLSLPFSLSLSLPLPLSLSLSLSRLGLLLTLLRPRSYPIIIVPRPSLWPPDPLSAHHGLKLLAVARDEATVHVTRGSSVYLQHLRVLDRAAEGVGGGGGAGEESTSIASLALSATNAPSNLSQQARWVDASAASGEEYWDAARDARRRGEIASMAVAEPASATAAAEQRRGGQGGGGGATATAAAAGSTPGWGTGLARSCNTAAAARATRTTRPGSAANSARGASTASSSSAASGSVSASGSTSARAAAKKASSLDLTDGSAIEDVVADHMGRVMATLAPLIAKSQRGGFLVNATRMFGGQPPIQLVGGRSSEGDATAKALLERRDGSRFAVGYYYGASQKGETKKAAAVRAKTASKMPLPPQAPRVLNQSPRRAKPIFRHAVRAEDEFNVPTMYRNWDRERNADQPDSEEARYGGAFVGESVAAG